MSSRKRPQAPTKDGIKYNTPQGCWPPGYHKQSEQNVENRTIKNLQTMTMIINNKILNMYIVRKVKIEPDHEAHPRSLTRAFAFRTHKVWK